MSETIIAVVGGRDFKDYDAMCEALAQLNDKDVKIISGGANGADTLAERWANEHEKPFEAYQAEWDNFDLPGTVIRKRQDGSKYNATAGLHRNKIVAEKCTHMIAFWDGKSPGTRHAINTAAELGKKVKVIKYEQ
jgi:YspA, cpYpsA-related SLOG family